MSKQGNATLFSIGNIALAWSAKDKVGTWRQAFGIWNERKEKPVIELLFWEE